MHSVPMSKNTPPPEPRYIDIRQASDRLGVHVETLRRWDRKGVLTAARLPNGHRRYLVADLEEFLSSAA
jgi:excisionase family DNA binding protein